jgi:hypothetical protein
MKSLEKINRQKEEGRAGWKRGPDRRQLAEIGVKATTSSFRLAPAFEPGIGDPSDGAFQNSLGFRERVIQAGSFVEFRFIHRFLPQQFFSRLATFVAQRIDLKRQQARAAKRQ